MTDLASTATAASVSFKERRWADGYALAVIGLSCLPYLFVLLTAPEGWRFAGILVNPFDGQSYLAKMRQGFEGNWLFHLTYTPEPHAGAFIFTFYLALGHLAAWLHLPLALVFHLARVLAGWWLLRVAFQFIATVTADIQERQLAFILVLTASGFGWLGVIFGAFPIDLWVPEAFVPYSLYAHPHFLVGMALMLVIARRVVWPSPDRLSLLWSGLAALALALVLPFALLTIGTVLTIYLIWRWIDQRRPPWASLWQTVAVGLASAPVILYDYWVSTTNPILAGWSAQNVTPAPPILDFILGYGMIGFLAIGGGWHIIRHSRAKEEWLLVLWAIVTIGLVYLPFDLQRRFINGLHLPLCLLATIGLWRWLKERASLRHRRLATRTVIALGIMGSLFVWLLPLVGLQQSPAESPTAGQFFLRDEEVVALNWLRENNRGDDVVLASPRLGTFIPAQTGARTFYGHPFETVAAAEKKATAEAFYQGKLAAPPPLVDFIIYGPSERAIGRPQNLGSYPVVFTTEEIEIYKVTK